MQPKLTLAAADDEAEVGGAAGGGGHCRAWRALERPCEASRGQVDRQIECEGMAVL
jgi:hypothetical protein